MDQVPFRSLGIPTKRVSMLIDLTFQWGRQAINKTKQQQQNGEDGLNG